MSNQETPVDTQRTAGLIPEGVHRFLIVDYEERQGPKAPYWNYVMEVAEGSDFDGKKVWVNISTSEAARWKMEEFLDAMGVANEKGQKVVGSMFIGKTVRGQVFHDEFEGRRSAKVDNFLPDAATAQPAATEPQPSGDFAPPPNPTTNSGSVNPEASSPTTEPQKDWKEVADDIKAEQQQATEPAPQPSHGEHDPRNLPEEQNPF